MSRAVRSFLPVGAAESRPGDSDPVTRFTRDPGAWLPRARHVGPHRWVLEVGAMGIDRPVEVTIGSPWHVGSTWWRSLGWVPLADQGDPVALERLLPDLDAELGLTHGRDRGFTLVLDGRYDPPGGYAGEALDAVALGRVARRTLTGLLEQIATALQQDADRSLP